MNHIEQSFSTSLNGSLVQGTSEGQGIRKPIHEDEAACKYILGTMQAPKGSLVIKKSTIRNSGSGLFTTRDLAEGELIFTSIPVILCAEVGEHMEACDFCFQSRRRVFHPTEDRFLVPGERLPPLHICNGCKVYQYCSHSCWQRAWDTGHIYECDLMAGASTDLDRRTLYRILLLFRKKILLPEQALALGKLEHAVVAHERNAPKTWQNTVAIAREAKERTKSELSVADILKLYCIIRVNALPVDQTFRNTPLGHAIDLGGSMLNHCCDPNVVMVFDSTQLQVRALQAIKAGEELLHCYRDIGYDMTFRNPRIKKRYQFSCHCARCREESTRHEGSMDPDIIPLILTTQAQLFQVMDDAKKDSIQLAPSQFHIEQHIANVDDILEMGYGGRPWPRDLEPLPTVLKALATMCERQGDLVNSVKIRVRGVAFTRYRKGLTWSEDMIDLVLNMSSFTLFAGHPALRVGALPKNKEFHDVFIGYLHTLHVMLGHLYGAQGAVTQVVHHLLQAELDHYKGPLPTTRAFRRKFRASHEVILNWAGAKLSDWPLEIE